MNEWANIVLGKQMAAKQQDKNERSIEKRIDVAHQSIASLGTALDEFEIAFIAMDVATTRLHRVNQTFAKMLGCEVEGLQSLVLRDLILDFARARLDSALECLLSGAKKKVAEEIPLKCSQGETTWFRFTFVRATEQNGVPLKVQATAVDVTRRKALEEELRLTIDRFDSAQSNSRVGSWEWAFGKNSAWWSKQLYDLHNIDPTSGTVTYDEFIETVDPNDREMIAEVNQLPFSEGDIRRFRFASNPAHGPRRHFMATVGVTNVNGEVVRRGTTQDVTDQVELLSALERSERQFREMVVSNTEGTAVLNLDGKLLQVDENFASMVGRQPSQLIGVNLCDLADSESAELIDQRILHRNPSESREVRLWHKDGHLVWLLLTCSPLLNDSKQFVGIQASALDITHRKHVELLSKRAAAAKTQLRRLTNRERQVLELIVEGRMNKVIANRLDISEKTVERHRSNLMKKLDAHSVAQLVKIWLTAEIMSPWSNHAS
ncbi:MAG: PAS domain S-box protein [Rhodopirellula sp. JB055]|uniref:PAS domain S-box protein n=1 Tax=Rhodopirellula sp. JB055 TaxID=3342846 RepID=UPI00370CD15D